MWMLLRCCPDRAQDHSWFGREARPQLLNAEVRDPVVLSRRWASRRGAFAVPSADNVAPEGATQTQRGESWMWAFELPSSGTVVLWRGTLMRRRNVIQSIITSDLWHEDLSHHICHSKNIRLRYTLMHLNTEKRLWMSLDQKTLWFVAVQNHN